MNSASAEFESVDDAEYDRRTREVFESVEATVDRFLQDDVIDIDASRTGGLVELAFPNGSKIVLNTQPPLHELWLAAQRGGFHFRPKAGRWVDGRDGREFFELLSECATEQGGRPLVFAPPGG
jgi:CyaY protein